MKPVKPAIHRPYTGNSDGLGTGTAPGLTVLIKWLIAKSDGGLWDNGSFGNRSMRGKPSSMSVHATGRAVDLSYRHMPNVKDASNTRGKPHGRKTAVIACEFLTKNADAIGLEAILDYFPSPYGRGWKCTRNSWENYKKPEIHGAPNGDWLHIEISPLMGKSPEKMREVLDSLPNPWAVA